MKLPLLGVGEQPSWFRLFVVELIKPHFCRITIKSPQIIGWISQIVPDLPRLSPERRKEIINEQQKQLVITQANPPGTGSKGETDQAPANPVGPTSSVNGGQTNKDSVPVGLGNGDEGEASSNKDLGLAPSASTAKKVDETKAPR